LLSSYAAKAEESKGRIFKESSCDIRDDFQRDRDRIVHSSAFRRLEYKTQVFVNHAGDHYRTRLTHSLEVAQIARSISRILNISEALSEAIALAHDLGHPPFGHAGEEVLNKLMLPYGGFDHNAHALKILTKLEQRYADFDGLNLSWDTLEGIAKHNGPLVKQDEHSQKVRGFITHYTDGFDLELDGYPSLEAQVASLADDIAYNSHDIEDGLRAGFFEVENLLPLPLIGDIFQEVLSKYGQIDKKRLINEALRRFITRLITDVVEEVKSNIAKYSIQTVQDVRNLGTFTASFSPKITEANSLLKKFLFTNMYRHYQVNRMNHKASKIIQQLFEVFLAQPNCLPPGWREKAAKSSSLETAEVVADYIAGMTDRFAIKEHQTLFGFYNL
jgi:dGTPase